ncbi:MAG: hypothetical protein IIA72_18695 [Proteobacteria bacterium]|nr:hypothetical protein [Pseudomonadota bacterium]
MYYPVALVPQVIEIATEVQALFLEAVLINYQFNKITKQLELADIAKIGRNHLAYPHLPTSDLPSQRRKTSLDSVPGKSNKPYGCELLI